MTREDLVELGFSEAMIAEQLGNPSETVYTSRQSAEGWKLVKARGKLTQSQHEEYEIMRRDHLINTGFELPKVKYSIEG